MAKALPMNQKYNPQLSERELVKTIREELRQMGKVLAALPLNSRDRPGRARSAWPEFHQENIMVSAQYRRKSVAKPSPKAISRADMWLQLVMRLPVDARRIVMARASGISWRRLEEIDGRSHTTLRKVEYTALLDLAKRAPDGKMLSA